MESPYAFRVVVDCRRPDPPHPSFGLLHRASLIERRDRSDSATTLPLVENNSFDERAARLVKLQPRPFSRER